MGVLPAESNGKETINSFVAGGPCLAGTLRSYRLAVACTGEYAQAVGGTTAPLLHSAIVTSVNRVNGVYEQEVSVRLVLIANNNLIEFLTPAGDQFTGNDNATILINESQTVINNNIGSANYDIGHTFSTGGGGLAQLGCVCTANKARGITGLPNPVGDAYDIDFVAHEIGHQFGGQHTFNANTGNCLGNGSATANAEPGSGSTIMAYAGICTNTNDLQPNSDPHFHAISFDQIGTFTRSGSGSTCGTTINTGNTAPVVNAGSDYTIPVSTPFMLTGTATDANNDVITYSWEQIDVGGTFSNWNAPSGATAPLFRSFRPSTSNTRIFPRMSDIVNNVTTIGEVLPATARTVKFRLTARDNRSGGGGICYDEANVITSGATAFNVTSQATATTWVANGTNTATITWTVAGTTAAPFNVANVDILFSTDGGYTYPYTLLSNTPNDGSQVITIPAATTTKGRVMVKSIGNIFFDINLGDITISSTCGAEGAVVAPATTVTSSAGSAPLNLGLSPQYSTPLTIAGTLQTTDPVSSLAVLNTATSSCAAFLNEMKYDTYVFTPSTTATYTFTLTGVFPTVMNLYSTSFDPSNSCTNFLRSNSSFTSPNVSIGASLSQALTAGNTYVIVVGTFSNTQPTLPAPYSVAVASVPAGGNIYGGSGIYINPGAGFNYAYVIVNNATGTDQGHQCNC
ncbi:MAG: reprolysin-like metallopeptidase [Ferruginibacter sp.]